MDDPQEDLSAQERAALVAWWLAHGDALTTADVARLTGLTPSGAHRLMTCLECALPARRDEQGTWQSRPMTAQERAVLVTVLLARGLRLTDEDIGAVTGLSARAVRYLMTRLARVLPIRSSRYGEWEVCAMAEAEL
jgi:DNA-binding CsgD family transcriptional regulator